MNLVFSPSFQAIIKRRIRYVLLANPIHSIQILRMPINPDIHKLRQSPILYLLEVYLLSILSFTLFRVILLSLHQEDIHHFGFERHWLVAQAFFMGFRFDTVITCYLLVAPMVLLGLLSLLGFLRPWILRIAYAYCGVVFIGAFFLCAADIPFYEHFLTRLNDTLIAWKAHSDFGFKMVLQESHYYWFILLFIAISCAYIYVLNRIFQAHLRNIPPARSLRIRIPSWYGGLSMLLLSALFLLGMRGRVAAKTPILAGAAYICDDPTINSLGLNPVFTFMRTYMDANQEENQRLHLIDDRSALSTCANMLHADPSLRSISPIARYVHPDAPLQGRNVVLVIMESMSTAKMKRFGNPDGLTPFFDGLADRAWSFDNIWSAGIHTYNGIYSTLFAHPALMKKHPMEVVKVPQIDGLPAMLRNQGYQTMFFTTHDELFDNMSGFLTANGVEHIIGQKDYPAKEVRSTMGVPDEFMFRYSIPVLSKAAKKQKPFFAAFMTGSDHDPIIIPTETGFHPRHQDKYKQSASYADWSLGKFLDYASHQAWYSNTLFVFVADHGCIMGNNTYDVAFSYQHIPLVFFAPGYTTPQSCQKLGLQTDVAATIMGLVGKPYLNTTFSTDLRTENKAYAIFSSDERLACMNDSLLYVFRTGTALPGLYHYRNNDPKDYYQQDSSKAFPMRQAAFSWLQCSQWLIENGKTARRY